jgi:hypothetical protein
MILGIGRFSVAIFHGPLNITASIVSDEPMIGFGMLQEATKVNLTRIEDDVTLFFAAR